MPGASSVATLCHIRWGLFAYFDVRHAGSCYIAFFKESGQKNWVTLRMRGTIPRIFERHSDILAAHIGSGFASLALHVIWSDDTEKTKNRSSSATFLRNCGTTDWTDATQPQNHGTRPKTVQHHVFYWKKTEVRHITTIGTPISNKIYQLISNYVHLKWFRGSSWMRAIWCTSLVVNQVFKQPFLQALLRVLGGNFCWNQYVSPWLAGCLSY